MNGRIEAYIHSDTITKNKGGAIVKVTTDTDFAAKVDAFKDFCSKVAKMAYAANSSDWTEIVKLFPELEETRVSLAKELKEKITISDIAILRL